MQKGIKILATHMESVCSHVSEFKMAKFKMTPKSIPLKMKPNKTRKHSSRMCTTHFPSSTRGMPNLPGCRALSSSMQAPSPWMQTPFPWMQTLFPWMQIPSSWMQISSPPGCRPPHDLYADPLPLVM